MAKREVGRIAFRVEGDWWAAYYALPNTMEGALELARIRLPIIADHPQRKDAFMKLLQQYIAQHEPAFEACDARPAPEHERAGNG